LDIRHVAPEIGCRPYVSAGRESTLSEHPGLTVMSEQGIVVDGQVHEQVATRMRTLAAPDVEVLALLSRGSCANGSSSDDDDIAHRYALSTMNYEWCWLVATIMGFGGAASAPRSPSTTCRSATQRRSPVWCSRPWTPSSRRPGADHVGHVPVDDATEAVKSWQESGFDVFARRPAAAMGLNAATVVALSEAMSDPRAEAVVYARQYRDGARAPSASVVSIKDGPSGRIAMYQQPRTPGSGQDWMAICRQPRSWYGSASRLSWTRFPYGAWEGHRRV